VQNKSVLIQIIVLFALILLNFLAQIAYFVHLYWGRQALSVTVRSFLIMGAVFAFFLAASWLFFTGRRHGYTMMLAFLSVEFLFYLFGLIQSLVRGFPPFFQTQNPDVVLRIIFSIGYMNLFASGYFILLLLLYRPLFGDRRLLR
jgi:hypothetical protein